MKKNTIMAFGFILLATSLSLWGCPMRSDVSSSPLAQKEETSGQKSEMKTDEAAGTKPDANADAAERSAHASGGLQPIHFDYDQSVILAGARKILVADAEWLKANPLVKITIEGNCDERGTAEYNQALGQRRATNAKKILTNLGIASDRIVLISFGKEKPVCKEANEACWQKNRRDDLIATQ